MVEMFDEFLYSSSAVPADNGGRDLVSHAVTEHCGVASAGTDPSPNPVLDLLGPAGLVQEGHLLAPVDPYHDPQPILLGHIHSPTRRASPDRHNLEADLP